MLCISMIVASVPECLPIAITATLSIGVSQMAKKKSIVRNLAAIETLGATEVICTDKTGTLTKNKMEVVKVYSSLKEVNEVNNTFKNIISFCNTAVLNEDGNYIGDSVDVALKNYLKEDIKGKKISEMPFDSDRKMMSVVYDVDGKVMLYIKGSFESILDKCVKVLIDDKIVKLDTKIKDSYVEIESNMAKEGLKILAFAYKEVSNKDYSEDDLILVGLVGLKDPVRDNIKNSIFECKEAGIRPIMLTGDNLITAYTIAKEVGICKSEKRISKIY